MLLLISIFSGVIIASFAKMFTKIYEKQIYEQNNNTASFVAQSIGSFMDMAYRATEQMADMDAITAMDTQEQTPILQRTAEKNDYFELIYIQDMNGDQTARSSGELGNRAGRWWFIEMMDRWEPFVSKSYYSISTNMACASIFIPLERQGEKIGVFATDIKLDTLQETVAQFSDVDKGKISFVIDGEGVVVAHPESVYYEELYNYRDMTRTVTKKDEAGEVLYDENGNIVTEEQPIQISEEYADVIHQVMSGEKGQAFITDDGKEYYVSYEPIVMRGSSDSWSVITLQEKGSAMILKTEILKMVILVSAVALVLAIIFIIVLSRSITKPIRYCLNRLVQLSEGDLTTEVSVSRGKDESAKLLQVLGETIETLQKIIGELSARLNQIAAGDLTNKNQYTYSGEFNEFGKSLNIISQSMNQAFRQVGISAQQVFQGANAISQASQSLAQDTVLQASAVEELTSTVQGTSEEITSNAQNAQQVREKMEQVNKEMISSRSSVDELLAAMNLIYEDSRKINGISRTIQDISFQTNLLSMNASVEASRAGEAGKGFSVIAGEIRELAQHCSEAAANTSELIETMLKEVEQGMTILRNTVDSIQNSAAETAEVNELVGAISDVTGRQAESMVQISAALAQISTIVQNNSAVAQQSAASSEEMEENAHRLQKILQKYRY